MTNHSMADRLELLRELLACYMTLAELEGQCLDLREADTIVVARHESADGPALKDIKHRSNVLRYRITELVENLDCLKDELV